MVLFGEEVEEFLEGNEKPLPRTIRCNTLAISPEELIERLESKGFLLKRVDLSYAFRVVGGRLPIGATTEYLLGYYFLQSLASMWAVEALNPKGTELVVDMCAAPGGKTTHIAQLMENKGTILATDINRSRMRGLRSNLSRMRVENVLAIRMDATKLPLLGIQADAVLLDAPCTGEGLIPLDPARKRSRRLEDIETMSAVQRRLISAAAAILREGGVLVYSTCSIAPEENEEVIHYALKRWPLRVIDTGLPIGEPGFTEAFGRPLNPSLALARRLYPYKHQTEGFFLCKLQKMAS